MKINSIFLTIQGEGVDVGLPTILIRTSGCNLNCSWCDARYAKKSKNMSVSKMINECEKFGIKRICITGGEPLIQNDLFDLVQKLISKKYEIIIETNGSIDIKDFIKKVKISLDVKCPGSGEHEKMLFENLRIIKKKDIVKFIIADIKDYRYAKKIVEKYKLLGKTNVIFQPEYKSNYIKRLADNIIKDKLDVRFSLQTHKAIWGANTRK